MSSRTHTSRMRLGAPLGPLLVALLAMIAAAAVMLTVPGCSVFRASDGPPAKAEAQRQVEEIDTWLAERDAERVEAALVELRTLAVTLREQVAASQVLGQSAPEVVEELARAERAIGAAETSQRTAPHEECSTPTWRLFAAFRSDDGDCSRVVL